MLVGPGAISSTIVLYREHLCQSRRNCGAIPLLKLGVEGGGKKQRGSAAANSDARLPSQRS